MIKVQNEDSELLKVALNTIKKKHKKNEFFTTTLFAWLCMKVCILLVHGKHRMTASYIC